MDFTMSNTDSSGTPGATGEQLGSPLRAGDQFPLRAKPEFYRQALYKILTKSQGQAEGFGQIEKVAGRIHAAQEKALGREMDAEEARALRLRTMRDIRSSLIALSLSIVSSQTASETAVRRTRNLPYLQWRVEKEILMQHWGCDMHEIIDRQVRSGQRMPRFLADAIESAELD